MSEMVLSKETVLIEQ